MATSRPRTPRDSTKYGMNGITSVKPKNSSPVARFTAN
jgi:hypothetical protein